jgi:hypothetical protein
VVKVKVLGTEAIFLFSEMLSFVFLFFVHSSVKKRACAISAAIALLIFDLARLSAGGTACFFTQVKVRFPLIALFYSYRSYRGERGVHLYLSIIFCSKRKRRRWA